MVSAAREKTAEHPCERRTTRRSRRARGIRTETVESRPEAVVRGAKARMAGKVARWSVGLSCYHVRRVCRKKDRHDEIRIRIPCSSPVFRTAPRFERRRPISARAARHDDVTLRAQDVLIQPSGLAALRDFIRFSTPANSTRELECAR